MPGSIASYLLSAPDAVWLEIDLSESLDAWVVELRGDVAKLVSRAFNLGGTSSVRAIAILLDKGDRDRFRSGERSGDFEYRAAMVWRDQDEVPCHFTVNLNQLDQPM